ncbi:hypothetical protein C8R47DRAFT_1118792 [Mycena vitilis]|nr:hypothetical protein C8R47DRAFT_1118792 [Mycena vitilis]
MRELPAGCHRPLSRRSAKIIELAHKPCPTPDRRLQILYLLLPLLIPIGILYYLTTDYILSSRCSRVRIRILEQIALIPIIPSLTSELDVPPSLVTRLYILFVKTIVHPSRDRPCPEKLNALGGVLRFDRRCATRMRCLFAWTRGLRIIGRGAGCLYTGSGWIIWRCSYSTRTVASCSYWLGPPALARAD